MTRENGNDLPDLLKWHPFHVSNWPQSIVHCEDYDGGPRLRLDWDLGRVDKKGKKQIIKQWCADLPNQQQLRWLAVGSHVVQGLFDAACGVHELECLQIKWSNSKSLDAIRPLTALR